MRRNIERLVTAISFAGVFVLAAVCAFAMFEIIRYAQQWNIPAGGTAFVFSLYAAMFAFFCWLVSDILSPESLREAFE